MASVFPKARPQGILNDVELLSNDDNIDNIAAIDELT